MAFDLDPRAPLHSGLSDIARAECAQAEAAFTEPTPTRLHARRKSTRRLRAWLLPR